MWNTISRGDDSPRTEILHNIDNRPPNESMLRTFQGMALRMGSMKLLMNVNNITWFKPPELGGEFPEKLLSNGLVTEERDEDVLAALMENYLVSNLLIVHLPPTIEYISVTVLSVYAIIRGSTREPQTR